MDLELLALVILHYVAFALASICSCLGELRIRVGTKSEREESYIVIELAASFFN